MLPALQPNDLIVIEKKEINELCVGDVIIFFSNQKYFIIHRLIKKMKIGNEILLITKGDNNTYVDKLIFVQKCVFTLPTFLFFCTLYY